MKPGGQGSQRQIGAVLRFYLKPLLLIATIAFAIPSIISRFGDLGLGGQAIAYAVLLGATWLALLCIAYLSNGLVRWVLALVLAICGYVLLTFEHASGQFMTFDAFISMMDSAGSLGDAVQQNGAAFLSAAWPSLFLLLGVGVSPRNDLPVPRLMPVFLPALVFAGLVGLLFLRGGDGGKGLPHPLVGSAYATLAAYDEATRFKGERIRPDIGRTSGPVARNLVLLIDESIAGQYLAINHQQGVAAAIGDVPEGVQFGNFGIAASISGCSAGANQALRFGGTRDDYRKILAEYPSIWTYAKEAGMRTVYIDGQRTGGAYQNNMDDAEGADIDEFVQFDSVPIVERDMAIAAELTRQLADPAPKFILVNKIGAHFPIHDKYPDPFLTRRPILPRGGYADVSDTGDRTGFNGTPDDWRRYRNSYRNTLDWNVGEFFRRIYDEADLADSVILYTSDHGQVLHEDGSPGLTTHCSADPQPEEGAVPLLAIAGSNVTAFDLVGWAEKNHDRSSHYMIFPTVLRLMGFDAGKVERAYGKSLMQESSDPMTFNRRFNARFGAEPEWRAIKPDNLPEPPAND